MLTPCYQAHRAAYSLDSTLWLLTLQEFVPVILLRPTGLCVPAGILTPAGALAASCALASLTGMALGVRAR